MSHNNMTRVKYTGATPGGDTNTYPIFTTLTNGWPAGFFALQNISKLVVDTKHDAAGTFAWYKSNDRGTSWEQIGTEAISAPASTVTIFREFTVEPYEDFKLDWVNGNTAQDPWDVSMVLIPNRSQP